MSQYQDGQDITLSVSEDLSSSAYYFVKIGASDNACLVNDSAGGNVLGVLQENVDGSSVAKPARIRVMGNSKLKLAGTVARGGRITSGSVGTGVAATGSNKHAPAIALESGVTGDIISVLLQNYKTDA
jgi:hypothetical protein